MNLMTMTKPQCSIYALAMALDSDPEIIIKTMGHDGLKLSRGKHIGVHITELQICALHHGYAGVLLGVDCMSNVGHLVEISVPTADMIMNHSRSVLFDNNHAYACDGHTVYDPNGKKFDLEIGWVKTVVHFGLLLYPISAM